MTKEKKTSSVIVQAGILAAASILVRIIGLLYRSPLTAIIGDEGNGYYGSAYNIYTVVLLISSYSVPSAISKLMAQKIAVGEYKNAQKVFHAALFYAVIVGFAASMFLYFGAGILVTQNAIPVLRIFAPTIFLFAILGVLRGYFQANQTMVQTSVSQILEQIVNAVVSIGAAWLLMRQVATADASTQARYGAMGSALGTGAGVATALIFMAIAYARDHGYFMGRIRADQNRKEENFSRVLKLTVMVITPFILSSFILNLTTSMNQTIYYKMMLAPDNYNEAEVATLYGLFSNKAVVITNIPISIATAVSAAIIPNISTSFATGDLRETKKRAVNAVRMTLIVAVPCAVGLMALSRPITMLLFPQWETLRMASNLLSILAVTVIFYSVSTITNAVLQAIGRMRQPLISAGIALIVQTGVLTVLLKATSLNIYALVVVSILYSGLIWVINELFMGKYLRMRVHYFKVYGKPVFAALVMGAAALLVYRGMYFVIGHLSPRTYFVNLLSVIPAIFVAIIVYFFVLIRIGGVKKKDIMQLPKGAGMYRLLHKLKWM